MTTPLLDRESPTSQASREIAISAGLFVAACLVYAIRNAVLQNVPLFASSRDVTNAVGLTVTLLVDVVFVVVLYQRAVTPSRKTPALIVGVVAVFFDIGSYALVSFAPLHSGLLVVVSWLANSTTILLVASWGVSRRRHPLWFAGLVPALILAVLGAWLYQNSMLWTSIGPTVTMFVSAVLWWVVIALGCCACWGLDALGRSIAPQKTAPADPGQSSASPAAQPFPPHGTPGYRAPTNSMSIASLVSALVFAPLGIVFGHIALSQMKTSGEDGRGLAIAGLVIGYLGTTLIVAYFVFFVVMLSAISSGLP